MGSFSLDDFNVSNVHADATAPTVTTIDRSNPTSATTNADSLIYQVTFSEAVSNLDTGDFSVTGTTATVTNVALSSGTTYNVTVSGGNLASYNGTVTLGFAGGQNITDTAGNALTATTPSGTNNPSYTLDNTAPTIAISTIAADDIINGTEDDSSVTVSGTTSGAEDGRTVTVYVGGVTKTASVSSNAWSVSLNSGEVLGLSQGSVSVTADVSDLAGNAATQATKSITYDRTAPTIAISTIATDDIINGTEDDSSVTVSGTTSGAEDGRTVTVHVGGVTKTASVSSNAWSVSLTSGEVQSLSQGSVSVSADVSDLAGNAATQATKTITYDSTAPTFDVAPAASSVTTTGFTPSASIDEAGRVYYVVLANGATAPSVAQVINPSGSELAAGSSLVSSDPYTPSFSAITSLNSGTDYDLYMVATDSAGNAMASVTKVDVTTTTPAPTVSSIVRAGGAAQTTNATSVDYTVTFSASVTGVNAADFSATSTGVTGASVTNVSGSGTTYTVTVGTGTGDGSIRLDVVDDDTIVNGSSVALGGAGTTNGDYASGQSYTIDKTAPTASVTAAAVNNSTNVTTAQSTETGTAYLVKSGSSVTDKASLDTLAAGNTANSATVSSASTNTTISTSGLVDGTYYVYAVDGAGNVSSVSTNAVTVDSTAPIISLDSGSLAYTENDAATAISGGATLTESGSPGSSVLTVQITANNEAADTLSLPTGTSTGINISSTDLRSGSTNIGTVSVSSVTNGTLWTLTFLSSATAQNIQDTIAAIRYNNTSDNPGTSNRTITFNLSDGTGNSATAATRTVTVAAVNDAPTNISLSASTVSTFDSSNATVGTLSGTDADNTTWTYTITGVTGPSGAVTNTNGAVFDLGTTGSSSSAGAVASATLRAVTPSSLEAGTYTITVQVNDGGTGGTYSKDLTVTVSNSLEVNVTAIENSVNGTYATDAADGSGLDLQEALHYANNASGAVTVVITPTLAGTITLPADLNVRNGITFKMDSDTDSRSLTIQTNSFALGGALTANIGSGDTLTINSSFADSGSVTSSLTKTGAGTLSLGGTNNTASTGLNDITVSAGTLKVSADSNLGTGAVTLNGGTLMLLSVGGTIDNAFTLGATGGTVNVSGSAATLSGNITGTGALAKTGGQLLTLSGTNTYSGGTSISGANGLSVTDGNNLGTGAVTFATTGTGLTITGSGVTLSNNIVATNDATITNANAVTLSGVISASGNLTKAGAGNLTLSATNTHTGAITVSAGTLSASNGAAINDSSAVSVDSGATLALSAGETIGSLAGAGNVTLSSYTLTAGGDNSTTAFTGAISGTGALTKTGSGTFTLSGSNTYTGATTISAGNLTVSGGSAISNSSAVTVASGATLALSASETVGSLAGAGTVTLGSNTLTAGGDASSTSFSGAIGGAGGGLTKTGSGTFTLSGTNTYTGATTVSAGELAVTGTLGNTSVAVASGATLDGTGSIGGAVTVASGSTLSAGTTSTAGNLVTGNLAVAGTFSTQLGGTTAGTNYDQIDVTGTVNLTGSSLSGSLINSFTPAEGSSYILIDNDGGDAVTGTFAGLAEGASVTIGGYNFTISYAGGTGNDVVLTMPGNPPVFASATVNGSSLVMTYTELNTLDATNIPATTAFTVKNGSTTVTVNSVVVNASAKTVTLTLASGVENGDTVTVAYTDPTAGNDANAIQDAAGNDAATLTATAVTNNTPAPSSGGGSSTPPPVTDDGDNVSNTVENQVPGIGNVSGDGNGDGVADSQQASVTSTAFLNTPTVTNPGDAQPVYVTLVADSQDGKAAGGSTATITEIQQQDAPADKPDDISMPLGLVSFKASAQSAGSTENFSLYVDGDVAVNGYWKQNNAGQWVNLASAEYGGQIVTEGGKTRLDFKLADGGEFDNDGVADGIISDPGAIGFRAAATPQPNGSDSDNDQFPDALEAANGLTVGVKDNDVFTRNDLFVMQLYRDYLYREVDSAGLQYWQTQLQTGTHTKAEVAAMVMNSDECQAGAANLARLYLGLLNRAPDAVGMDYWMAQYHNGSTFGQIANAFTGSDEFNGLYGGLGNAAYVEALYRNALGRASEESGRNHWTARLGEGWSKGDLAAALVQSVECISREQAQVGISLDYVGLLGRTPDEAGYANWQHQQQAGMSEVSIIGQFIATTEYHDRFLPSLG